jgi:hypothetical protein
MQKPPARSKISNGYLLPIADGRSTWMRRLRDVIQLHLADMNDEPPRDCRRLQLLRRWSHDKQDDK